MCMTENTDLNLFTQITMSNIYYYILLICLTIIYTNHSYLQEKCEQKFIQVVIYRFLFKTKEHYTYTYTVLFKLCFLFRIQEINFLLWWELYKNIFYCHQSEHYYSFLLYKQLLAFDGKLLDDKMNSSMD